MMRKNNNQNRNKHRGNNGGGRRYNNNGGGNRNNDGQNIARQKHHATQMLGKFSDLARNAQSNGDRVDVEYYLQHVEHYSRVLAEIAGVEAERFAHQREHLAAHAGADAQPEQSATDGNAGDQGAEGDTTGDAQTDGGQPRQHQPRQRHRHPRQHYSAPASDNGAAEANANKEEIPLPGNILPPI